MLHMYTVDYLFYFTFSKNLWNVTVFLCNTDEKYSETENALDET